MALKIHKESEYSIYCSICSNSESIYTGDSEYQYNDTPSRYFKRQGWREIDGDTVCKGCRNSNE